MKKVILGLILIIVMVIAGSVYYLFTNLDALIEAAIEKYGSEATQTSLLVDSVKTDLTNGAASITGLTIGNPKGFDLPDAFVDRCGHRLYIEYRALCHEYPFLFQ